MCPPLKAPSWDAHASILQVASFDSMAWDFGTRMSARKEGGPNTLARRALAMRRWYDAQKSALDG